MRNSIFLFTFLTFFSFYANQTTFAQCTGEVAPVTTNLLLNKTPTAQHSSWLNYLASNLSNASNSNTMDYALFSSECGDGGWEVTYDLLSNQRIDVLTLKYVNNNRWTEGANVTIEVQDDAFVPVFSTSKGASFNGQIDLNTTGRYIKLYFDAGRDELLLYVVQASNTIANLALNMPITTAYSNPTSPAPLGVDGSNSTYARLSQGAGDPVDYLVDLKIRSNVYQIEMLSKQSITGVTVLGMWDDGYTTNWVTIKSSINLVANQNLVVTDPILEDYQGQWTKFKIYKSSQSSVWDMYEIRVKGMQAIGDGKPFIDRRDGHVYNTIKLNDKLWMTENLDYNYAGSVYYNNDEANYKQFGRYYVNSDASIQDVCPCGWRLPTYNEFVAVGNTTILNTSGLDGKYAGFFSGADGIGGHYNEFLNMGINLYWRTSSRDYSNVETNAYSISINNPTIVGSTQEGYLSKYNVRCVSDKTKSAKVQDVKKTKTVAPQEGSFDVYPNPTKGVFNIEVGQAEQTLVNITGMDGKQVYQNLYNGGGVIPLDLNLKKGIYIVSIKTEKRNEFKKLVVE